MNSEIKLIIDYFKNLVIRNKRKVLIVVLVFFLYVFVAVTFKVMSMIPKPKPMPRQYSNLDLVQFIKGYRTYQQDFEVEKIFFTDKALEFTLNIKFNPKNQIVIKKLTMDIMLGINAEYPELDSVSIDAVNGINPDAIIMYGRAVYSKDDKQINWKMRWFPCLNLWVFSPR